MNAYELKELLKSGKRLPKPRPCPPLIYNLMIRCWNASPAMRPTFEELISSFELLPYLVIGAGDDQYARKLVTFSPTSTIGQRILLHLHFLEFFIKLYKILGPKNPPLHFQGLLQHGKPICQ